MIESLSVTAYSPEHMPACSALFQKVYGSPPFGFDWLDGGRAEMYFTDLERMPNALNYILNDSEEIVGACMGQQETHFQNPGYKINEFFIDPERQHMGLGTYFLNELENQLRPMGIKVIYLFTQRHMGSYAFYRRNDFLPNEETVHMARLIKQEPTVVYARAFLNAN